jgi:hypothetical protein
MIRIEASELDIGVGRWSLTLELRYLESMKLYNELPLERMNKPIANLVEKDRLEIIRG